MIGHQPSIDELMTLTHQEYFGLPQSVAQAAFEVAVSSPSTKKTRMSVPRVPVQTNEAFATNPTEKPSQVQKLYNVDLDTLTYSHVSPNVIRTVDFMRYTNFTLEEQMTS